MAQCTAKSKQSGVQCKRHAKIGKKVCKIHGGDSLEGFASPNFKHGKYGNSMPVRLVQRYEEALSNPDLLSLNDEIALMEARIVELIEGLDTGGIGEIWKNLKKSQKTFQDALNKGDYFGMQEAFKTISETIQQGAGEQERWNSLQNAIFARQRLVESERKHLQELGQMVSVRELTVVFASLVQVLREHITDRKTLGDVLYDLEKTVFNRNGGRLADDSGDNGIRLLYAP